MDFKEYIKVLEELISFKSISTDSEYKKECEKTAKYLQKLFKENGFEAELLKGKETNPYVFAQKIVDSKADTVLIYGHYDVQPADKENGWKEDPFTVLEEKTHIYGRGVVDNKGQTLIHILNIFDLIKEDKLAKNVKFFIEGNEETGNEEISSVIEKNKQKLACDYVVISDGECAKKRPTLDVGFRGGANLTIKYKTANNNMHSGIFGGAVPNAANELAKLVSKLQDTSGKVLIPGFYDDVDEITKDLLENNKSIDVKEKEILEMTGVKKLLMEKDMDFLTQVGLRPMLTVSGLGSGYTGVGYSNIVSATAEARVNFRFVASQDPKKVLKAFKKFVVENTPDYVDVEITVASSWPAIKMNTDKPVFRKTVRVLEEAYQDAVAFKYVGGSIPVVGDFANILGVDVLSISMGNEDCAMHGVNENFEIELIKKGAKFSKEFFSKR